MQIKLPVILSFVLLFCCCTTVSDPDLPSQLRVSENRRFLVKENGDPFFWLGDTGWLLFTKLNREEAEKYLDDRHQKGFNVVQVMVLHNVSKAVNVYGDSALIDNDIEKPLTTPGNSPTDAAQYDFWDHVDYLVSLAQDKGIYLALVPVWGSNVRNGGINTSKAGKYAAWLAGRYKDRTNVIWLNGGDVKGSDSSAVWNTIGSVLREKCPRQLISFHPFGRTQSSEWFQKAEWLDFNMFQSGHRRYDQDTAGLAYGEDNWKYVISDYAKEPVRPTLDGEPSYEGIPQGLHDPSQPYWTDSDLRRYAYWSVFAGGCGFTYGHNAIMQFHREGDTDAAYGVKDTWVAALNSPGASQMKYLKKLILSRSYFDRIPAQDLVAASQGEKYDYIAATRGNDYAFIYTWSGNTFSIDCTRLKWTKFKASWYNPVNGESTLYGVFDCTGVIMFDPPGEKLNGNDWVLVLDKK
jgi:hypothetical protein